MMKQGQISVRAFARDSGLSGLGFVLLFSAQCTAEPKAQDAAVQQVLRKAQGVVRQLTEENKAFGVQLETLKGENSQLKTEKQRLEAEVQKLQGSIKELQGLASEVQQLKGTVQTLQGVKETLRTERTQSKQVQSKNQSLHSAVEERERLLESCRNQNREVIRLAREAIDQTRSKDLFDDLADLEPLTGLGRIERENQAADYHYQIDHLRFDGKPETVIAPAPRGELSESAEEDP